MEDALLLLQLDARVSQLEKLLDELQHKHQEQPLQKGMSLVVNVDGGQRRGFMVLRVFLSAGTMMHVPVSVLARLEMVPRSAFDLRAAFLLRILAEILLAPPVHRHSMPKRSSLFSQIAKFDHIRSRRLLVEVQHSSTRLVIVFSVMDTRSPCQLRS